MTTNTVPSEVDEGLEDDRNEIDFLRASQSAQAALDDQNQAKELTQRAAATNDPIQREGLLRQALEKEVKARKQGKSAEWLREGAVQGALSGAGIGSAMGAGLGLLTGTLVGSTTSLAFGGLGAGLGGGIGAAHGPFYDFDNDSTAHHEKERVEEEPIVVKQPAAVASPVEAERVLDEVARKKTPPPERLEKIANMERPSTRPNQQVERHEIVQTNGQSRAPTKTASKPRPPTKESDVPVRRQDISESQIQEIRQTVKQSPRAAKQVESPSAPRLAAPTETVPPRKKPRKLEIKSPPKKKPRKLEIRSPARTP